RGNASPDHHSSMSMAALASLPHGASALPASAVPTVLERFPGFVRCVMDIAPEVVGWVIGRSGAHIKEMKHRSGCGMWVDQKDLKLYITGADMPRIHAAAALVVDLISKAPVNVNSAGVEDEVTSHMIECPPHLIGLLIGRGGSTIKRIKEESRANVVINQKMMKVIVSGIPQSVRLGVAMIEDVITFGRSAEHGAGLGGAVPPNFLDFPAGVAGMAEFMDDGGGGLDSFTVRSTGPPGQQPFMNPGEAGGVRMGSSPLSIPGSGDPGSNLSAGGVGFPVVGGGPYDDELRRQQQLRGSPASSMMQQQQQDGGGMHAQQQQQQQRQHPAAAVAAGGGGGGRPAKMEADVAGFNGKEMDCGGLLGHNSAASGGSRTGSISSGGTPPLVGRSLSMGPWNVMGAPPIRGVDTAGGGGGGAPPLRLGNSPATGLSVAGALMNMNRLSINSDDSNSGGRSIGQASRQRERPGTPVGNPADLAEFLGDMGLGQYAQALTENEIDLEAVQLMADSDFQDIGIPKGPRVKLLYALRTNRYPPKSGDLSTMKTFLASLGLDRYCKAFEDAEVDMGAVDVMEESDYAQLGVAKWSFSVAPGGGGGPRRAPSAEGEVDGGGDVDPAAAAACSPQAAAEDEAAEGVSREEDEQGETRGVGWVGGGVSDAEEALSPPADVWVASALRNAEEVLDGGDGSP
ncbi:unnamed protein product, partial [Ectocarpus sp. 8 AP-2014]